MDLQNNHQYKQLKGPTIRPSKKLKKNPTTKQEHKKIKIKIEDENNHQNEREINANGKLKNQKTKNNNNEDKLETQILRKQ